MRRVRTLTTAVIIAGVMGSVLAGCATIDPVEVSVIDGKLAFAFCEPYVLDSLEVRQRPSDAPADDWSITLAAGWSGTIPANTPIAIGAGDLEFEDPALVELLPGTSYEVLYAIPGEDAPRTSVLDAPPEGFKAETWVRSNGSTRPNVCGT